MSGGHTYINFVKHIRFGFGEEEEEDDDDEAVSGWR